MEHHKAGLQSSGGRTSFLKWNFEVLTIRKREGGGCRNKDVFRSKRTDPENDGSGCQPGAMDSGGRVKPFGERLKSSGRKREEYTEKMSQGDR